MPILHLCEFDFQSLKYMLKKTYSFSQKLLTCAFCFFLVSTVSAQEIPTDEAVIASGEGIFKANCTQCHKVHQEVIGPALESIYERRSIEWLNAWIKNSQKLIASGDEDAVALYEEYNKTQMPAYPFSDDEIMSLLSYIKHQTDNPPVDDIVISDPSDETGVDSVSSGYLTAIIIVMVVVLALALIALIIAVTTLTKYLKKQKGLDEAESEVVNQSFDVIGLMKGNTFLGLVVFVFTLVVLKTLIDGAFTIGVQQGYQPSQPIAFSHKIHAGKYEIDCQYCHTGVRKSKSANIPSPNICMNCHTQVKTESEEVRKIYAAIDYDPETKTYGTNTRPIEWIRVHNLPDLAYFNHSQHVKVAEIECQTCHGSIEEMEVVYQYANLTMGWCINCHRETAVTTKGNEYYTKLVKLHAEQSKEPMKVEDIGGLECAKCHY